MSRKETDCENAFRHIKQVYNANTPENHPILFKTVEEYKDAMSILALCSGLFPDVCIYAFQIMSNHVHLVVSGDEDAIKEFFIFFTGRLNVYFDGGIDLRGFTLKLFPVHDLSYMRNAIAYVNRNGFVVNPDVTPFSYPWGSSRYFFQPVSLRYDALAGKPIGVLSIRALMHSHKFDGMKDFRVVDGYVSPLEFCRIETAQEMFRDAKQYFWEISRNVETYAEIARTIGESIFYNDNDLYAAAAKLSKSLYDNFAPRSLPPDAKIELARRLHFDYNAGDKQIQRLLNINGSILKALF